MSMNSEIRTEQRGEKVAEESNILQNIEKQLSFSIQINVEEVN